MKFEKRGQDMLWNFRREGIVFTLIFLLFEFMNVFIWVHVFIFCAFFVFGACLYVCVHAQIYARTNSYTKHAHTNSCTNIHVHTDIHIYMYTHIYIHVHTHIYMYTQTHTHKYTRVHTHHMTYDYPINSNARIGRYESVHLVRSVFPLPWSPCCHWLARYHVIAQ